MAGVRRYEDLDCWRLADELKAAVYDLIERSPAKKDLRFRDQLTDSAGSATSNIAEAFGYYRHPESARHARIAKASLTETHNHLQDGVKRRHWATNDIGPLLLLAQRSIGATAGWIRHLETTETPPPYWDKDRKIPTRKRRRGK